MSSFCKQWAASLPVMDWHREELIDDVTKVRFKFTLNIAHKVVLESLVVLKRKPHGKAWVVDPTRAWQWSAETKTPPYRPSHSTAMAVVDAFRAQVIYQDEHLE